MKLRGRSAKYEINAEKSHWHTMMVLSFFLLMVLVFMGTACRLNGRVEWRLQLQRTGSALCDVNDRSPGTVAMATTTKDD